MPKKVFPREIYVIRETPAGESYLNIFEDADEAIDAAGSGGRVATYTLTDIGEAKISRELVNRRS